jgi:hypothetical protein
VVGESVKQVKAVVPGFELPANFFEDDLCVPGK